MRFLLANLTVTRSHSHPPANAHAFVARRSPTEQAVQQFLATKGYAQYALHICRAFAGAQYPESEWVGALQQMPDSALAELVAAAQRETGA